MTTHRGPESSPAYQRFPAKDVAIETDPVLREVESSLEEDVPLQSTGVVCNTGEDKNTNISEKTLHTLH